MEWFQTIKSNGGPMKRHLLEKKLKLKGAYFFCHGANHDIWKNAKGVKLPPIPRHNEIKDLLANAILAKA